MSHLMTKPTKWHVRPAKTQINLGIRPDWSESSLCAQWVAKDPSFLHADAQADLSLLWAFGHFVCFVMRRLISFYYKAFHVLTRLIPCSHAFSVLLSIVITILRKESLSLCFSCICLFILCAKCFVFVLLLLLYWVGSDICWTFYLFFFLFSELRIRRNSQNVLPSACRWQ